MQDRFSITPPAWLTEGPVARVLALLPGARAVGGAVRDTLAGLAVADIHLATELPPELVARRLQQAGIKVVPTGITHGTVTAVADGQPIEITTLRRDVATDGRHAVVAFDADWREDALRRDFTINAMSLGPDGTLFDYFGGRADLAAGRVRFVGDASARISEDFLRALRWFRFQARYGRGAPDAQALAAITAAAPQLQRLSAERVWGELKRILGAPDPRGALALMEQTGVLHVVLPEGANLAALNVLVAVGAPADPLLRFSVLLGDTDIAAPARRLRLSRDEAGQLGAVRHPDLWGLYPGIDDAALRRLLFYFDPDLLIASTWHTQSEPDPVWDQLRARIAAMPAPHFPLRAVDVGLPEGPRVGQVLAAMRGLWLAGGCVADRETLAAEARRRIAAGLL